MKKLETAGILKKIVKIWNNYSRKEKGPGIRRITGGDDCPVELKTTHFNGSILHDFLNLFISIGSVWGGEPRVWRN